jgi:hypothetical protein
LGVFADPAGLVQAAAVVGQQADPPDRLEGEQEVDRPPDIVLVIVDAADEGDADPDLAPGRGQAFEIVEDGDVRNAGELAVAGVVT